jgi:hypothetical protein
VPAAAALVRHKLQVQRPAAAERPGGRECGLPLSRRVRGSAVELVTDILAGPGGQVPAQLQPLADGLVSMRRPQSGVIWLRRSVIARQTLRDLASDRIACSHATLDAVGADRAVEYLRCLLVRYGVLAPRDRRLATAPTSGPSSASP